eukprot:scpid107461/ scgid34092/ 
MIRFGSLCFLLLVSSIPGRVQSSINISSNGRTRLFPPVIEQAEELTTRLCSVPNASSARTLGSKTCSIKDVGEDIILLLHSVLREELAQCPKIVDPRRNWRGNLWCAAVTFAVFRFNYSENKYLSTEARQSARLMLKSSHSLNVTVHHSRNIIEKCNLKQVSSRLYCGNASGLFACRLLVLSKTLLFFFTHPPKPNQTLVEVSHTSLGCWEQELEEARQLLTKPGKWDIDDKCVDTLKDIYSKLFSLLIPKFIQQIRKLFVSIKRRVVYRDLIFELQSKLAAATNCSTA